MNELVMVLMFGWSTLDAFQSGEFRADRPTPLLAPAEVEAVAETAVPAAAKHTILFFTADRCPNCVRMKTQTLPNVLLPGHDLRFVDVDVDPGLAQSYGIQNIPAYVVLDNLGRAYRQGVGFRDVVQFINFLNGR